MYQTYGVIDPVSNTRLDVLGMDVGLTWFSMQEAAQLITLCGCNITDLKLSFKSSMGFSKNMLDAIGDLQSLKVLILLGSKIRRTRNNSKSIEALLTSTTKWESLSIHCVALDSLDLWPGSSPNLSHLWLATYPENQAALTRFCKDVAMDVKIFECLSPENQEDIAPMIVSLRNSIEILFLECIPDNLPGDLCAMYFLKLTVFQSIGSGIILSNLSWLQWPVFVLLEVFITSCSHSKKDWLKMLTCPVWAGVILPKNFKWIIYTSWKGQSMCNDELVHAFLAYDIKCLFRPKLTHRDMLESLE
ncbi:uncharacterized protein MELLADRAFT_68949 [Melampsora larici-populina 98AG31]|uniref:Uncharacterized protein n=1 Tax=Melampsora larici-populina (strain 98AG31 / pathotype 3-4-7) TaxID=747676 RepID=F4S8U2_MELLP|nr:uncharacterized protein MELLADRAFT_68949 [Melampsora larici-populina 98AG31]EGF98962.1 hypothetical protein MELLADRAFT_68949 [Melampsora larici-populina 98AG31]